MGIFSKKKLQICILGIIIISVIILFVISITCFAVFSFLSIRPKPVVLDTVTESSEEWICNSENFTFTIYNMNNIPEEYMFCISEFYNYFSDDKISQYQGHEVKCIGILKADDLTSLYAVFFDFPTDMIRTDISIFNYNMIEQPIEEMDSYSVSFKTRLSFDKSKLIISPLDISDAEFAKLGVSELVFHKNIKTID